MKKLLLIALLSILSSTCLAARMAWVDNKAICEKTEGNWQFFNNDCADSCESNFSLPVCSVAAGYNCDCGVSKCWDGDKCVSNKIAKKIWDEKAAKLKEAREKELKILQEKIALYNAQYAQAAPNNSATTPNNNITTSNSTTTTNYNIANTAPTALAGSAPATINPETERKNNENKQLCEQKNGGVWKEFKNGCVDSCSSQIATVAMCTSAITLGCECGENKCWDIAQSKCLAIDDYKKLIGGATPANSLPSSLPNLPINNSAQPNLKQ